MFTQDAPTPIFSAMVPGLGQMVNREPAKGTGYLLGAVALVRRGGRSWRIHSGVGLAGAGAQQLLQLDDRATSPHLSSGTGA